MSVMIQKCAYDPGFMFVDVNKRETDINKAKTYWNYLNQEYNVQAKC